MKNNIKKANKNNVREMVRNGENFNLKLKEKDPSKYWIFNEEVTEEEWENRFDIGKQLTTKEEDKE